MQEPLRAAEMGRLGRQRVEQMFSVEREAVGVAAVYAHVWDIVKKGGFKYEVQR
jgi:hypothetical protein